MSASDSKLEGLEQKIKILLRAYGALKQEQSSLIRELAQVRQQLADKEEELKSFQNQHKISKIVTSISDGTQDNTELKQKINEFIREIDKCIAHLSE